MADYWKSQPRKFCQYCKCWIADNKPSIEFHERGKNHKENVAAKIAEIKKKSVAKAKQEERMSKEFAAMEEAALKAYQEDLKRMGMESGTGTGSGLPVLAAPQPIPQPKPQPAPPNKKQHKKKHNKSSRGPKPTPLWVEGKTHDGNTYYYNTTTGESQWERPEGFQGGSDSVQPEQNESPWMECVSPDGYTYYYNSASGESSWEKPTDFTSSEAPTSVCESSREQEGEEPSTPQTEPPPGEDRCSDGDEGAQQGIQQKRKAEDVSSEKEEEKRADDGVDAQEHKTEEETNEVVRSTTTEPEVKTEVIPAKRKKAANPYGAWEKIQEEKDPYASVDLQLPQVEADVAATLSELPPEPKPKFKERIITSLGGQGGPASFKKSKTQNGKTRSLRQRDEDDD